MKIVDLGNSAVAIELDEQADRITRLDIDQVQASLGDEASQILRRYIDASVESLTSFDIIPGSPLK